MVTLRYSRPSWSRNRSVNGLAEAGINIDIIVRALAATDPCGEYFVFPESAAVGAEFN